MSLFDGDPELVGRLPAEGVHAGLQASVVSLVAADGTRPDTAINEDGNLLTWEHEVRLAFGSFAPRAGGWLPIIDNATGTGDGIWKVTGRLYADGTCDCDRCPKRVASGTSTPYFGRVVGTCSVTAAV